MKKIRQIISILSVMAVVVSATVGISRASAEETNIVSYELDTTTKVNKAWLDANAGSNLLKGCYVREVRNTGSYDIKNPDFTKRLKCINDNDIGSISNLTNTSANPAYSFDPKKTMKVNKVLVSFEDSSSAKNFDVYFSQTEAEKCPEGQTGAVFDRKQNHISVTAQEGKKDYLLDLTSEQTCEYIIVEIFKGESQQFNCNIAEIAAYGEEYKLDDFDQSFLVKNASKNIATGISVQEYRNGGREQAYSNLTDNNLSTLRGKQGSSAATIDYDLSFAYGRPVKQLILAYADNSDILDFDVYISNIFGFENTTSNTYVNNIESVTAVEGKKNYLITLDEPVMASRVVFRLNNPDAKQINYDIAELGVYADDLDYIPNAVDSKDEYVANNYANILTNKNVKVTLEDTNSASLTDGKFDNRGCALTGAAGNYALTVDYELPEVFTFNKFMVAPIYGNLPQGVAIYVSETAQGLETAKPIEFTHNRSSKSILGKNQNKALEITLNSPVKAKFIRFKFTDAEGELYVSEIGAYSYADTNRDADFNICDLVYINKNLGTANVYADYNKDSTVDVNDINALRSELLNK